MVSTNAEGGDRQLVTPRSSIQRITNGNRLSQNSRPRFAPQHAPVDPPRRLHHVVMVVPVDADVDEGQDVGAEDRQLGPQRREPRRLRARASPAP